MIMNLPERITAAEFMIQANVGIPLVIKMFMSNDVRFYRYETPLTFSDSEKICSGDVPLPKYFMAISSTLVDEKTIPNNADSELSGDALSEKSQPALSDKKVVANNADSELLGDALSEKSQPALSDKKVVVNNADSELLGDALLEKNQPALSDKEVVASNADSELSGDALSESKQQPSETDLKKCILCLLKSVLLEKQQQQQFEAGFLYPDFNDEADIKSLLIAIDDIKPWFNGQSIILKQGWDKELRTVMAQRSLPQEKLALPNRTGSKKSKNYLRTRQLCIAMLEDCTKKIKKEDFLETLKDKAGMNFNTSAFRDFWREEMPLEKKFKQGERHSL